MNHKNAPPGATHYESTSRQYFKLIRNMWFMYYTDIREFKRFEPANKPQPIG